MTVGGALGLLARGSAACGLAGLALTLGVVACGDGGDSDGTAEPPVGGAAIPGVNQEFDGCSLLDELDAEVILRGRVLPGAKPPESPAAATCMWEYRGGEHPRSIQLSVFRGGDLYGVEGSKDAPTFKAVEGIGKDAFFVEPSGVQLHFLTDEYSVVISVDGFDSNGPLDKDDVKGQIVALAKRVVESL